MKETYIKYKRKLAQSYIEWQLRDKVEKYVFGDCMDVFHKFISKNVTADSVIVDIGAGNGYYTFKILDHYDVKKIYCLERSKESLKKIWDRGKINGCSEKIKLVCGDINKAFVKSNVADIVMCNTLLHEFEKPDQLIRQFAKLLKKDGYLFIIDFRNTWLGRFVGRGYQKSAHGAYELEDLKKTFCWANLEICDSRIIKHWVICVGRKIAEDE